MADKVPTAEDFNKENIRLKHELDVIKNLAASLAYNLEMRGETKIAKKVEHIAIVAHRAMEATNER